MAYKHRGHKNNLHRAIALLLDALPAETREGLATIRWHMIAAANAMAQAAFVADPLFQDASGQAVDTAMLAVQKADKSLNSCYIEAARMNARTAINNSHRKFFNCLVGRLAYVDSRIRDDERNEEQQGRIYYNIPTALQNQVTRAELDALKAVPATDETGYEDALALFRRVLVEKNTEGMTPNQVAILAEIHRLTLIRHRLPVFGRDRRHVVQIHLNCHIIRKPRGSTRALQQLQQGGEALIAKGKGFCQAALYLSHPTLPGGPPMRLDLTLMAELANRLFKQPKDFQVQSLILEIGADWAGARVVTVKRKPAISLADINRHPYILANDFGYRRTGSVSVVRRDRAIDPDAVEYLQTLNKEETKHYYETHHHPMDQTVFQADWDGKPFLDRIYAHSLKIDQLRSEIDRGYLRLERLKANLKGHLRLAPMELIREDQVPEDPVARNLHARFFRLLANLRQLKQLRRERYAKIRAVKKCWFGFVVNRIVDLVEQYDAVVVREALDIVAEEKGSPTYKGRTFNKMINAGAQGQFNRRLDQALEWLGRLLVKVPSYYSSTSCEIHSRVDKKMRRQAVFKCPPCGKRLDADAHGSETLACFLLLRPGAYRPGSQM